jgi:AraC-like DNA-binding protein
MSMSEAFFYSLEGPLDSVPVGLQIRAANLTGFSELVRGLGADPRDILERHGIDPRAMRDPDAYIDSKALVQLMEHCSRAFNDPLFGLRLGDFQDPDTFGAIATLCRSASSFREALACFIDYIPVVHCPLVAMELVEGPEITELRWRVQSDPGVADQASYKGTLMTMKLLRQLAGRSFKPRYVGLRIDARQKDLPEIAKFFGCEFRPRAEASVIAFPSAVLDQPVASANRLLFRLLGGYFERVRHTSRQGIVERVEDYVRGSLSSGKCSIEHCAGKMGLPVRTLQASLSNHGLRFSEIVERQRRELAESCLQASEVALDELAAMLGYSEQSSFGRAFKRWTGSTPQGYRRHLELRKAA